MHDAGLQTKNMIPVGANRQKSYRRALKRGLTVVVAVLIFGLGFMTGQGNLSFGTGPGLGQSRSAGLPATLNYGDVTQVYRSLKDNYDGQLDASKLEDGMKAGLASATGDPYTVFFTAAQAKQFNDQLNNSFSGIGAELGKDGEGNIMVVAPINGFPADKAGLKAKDIISTINNTPTTGMSIDDAVSKIRGKKGTEVTLKIIRDKSQVLSLTITRDDIKLPSVKSKMLDNRIGYVQISTFAEDTSSLMRQAANTFAAADAKGVILDLRDNPGGLLDSAVDVSSLWLPQGQTVLQEKRGGVVIDTYTSTSRGKAALSGVPTVVLVNSGSASASEITAGALHDNKAAIVIGSKSYGKGSVQQIVKFADGSELKVTVARWYRPNGQNIDKKGITPDHEVLLSDSDAAAGQDTQLQAAQEYLNR